MRELIDKIAKYNFWDGKMVYPGYPRSMYLEKISHFLGNKLIKVITGQRRVGKSYILRQIIKHLIDNEKVNPQNIFYLNKEFLAFEPIKNYADLDALLKFYKREFRIAGKVYVFLDEVQNIEQWEKFVNSYAQDFTDQYEIFITGSNAKLLSGELASLLSGRYVQFEIYPFSFHEYTGFKQLVPGKNNFMSYLKTGGLPEILNLNHAELVENYVQSLKDTIILRDIIQRHSIKDIGLLDDLFKFLSVNIGNLTSLNRIVKYFKHIQKKTNYETLSNYLEYIKDTFVIHEVLRYDLRGKKVLGGVRKYYLNDLAFKNVLYGFLPTDIGNNLENYVYIHLRRMGFAVSVGTMGDNEIDFVARKAGKTFYIQVAYLLADTKTVEREFGNLEKIKDNHPKLVVSADELQLSDYRGIKHVRAWELENLKLE